MTQGCVPEEEELKLQQRPGREDEQGQVSALLDTACTPFPAVLTHKSLIDEILSEVHQDQGYDVPQQALEESQGS